MFKKDIFSLVNHEESFVFSKPNKLLFICKQEKLKQSFEFYFFPKQIRTIEFPSQKPIRI